MLRGKVNATSRNTLNYLRTKRNNVKQRYKKLGCDAYLEDYLVNSTLHGLRYVGGKHLSLAERAFFFVAFIFVAVCSAYFISNVWEKWSASPVIITLSSTVTPITSFPFPAVTICNMNQAKDSAVRKFTSVADDELLQNLCRRQSEFNMSNPFRTGGKWPRFRKYIMDVSQQCDEMLLQCKFGTEYYDCLELFNTVLTDEGLCCIFNAVAPKFLIKNYNDSEDFSADDREYYANAIDWTPERGFRPSVDTRVGQSQHFYPRPGIGSGSHLGLTVILNANTDDYYCSSTNSIGFKILLHNPIETPKIADYGIAITPGFESRIIVTPNLADTSDALRRVPGVVRQCIFENEYGLSYYRTYSRKNCEQECESRIVLNFCNCIMYYMPRIAPDLNICGPVDWHCYHSVKDAMDLGVNKSFTCSSSCMPACFGISYDSEMSISRIMDDSYGIREKMLRGMTTGYRQKNIAVLQVYYKETFYRSQNKEELIGFTEFLSNTGGLLGLFMGFSVVSLIEIFYFVSLRPYYKYLRHMRAQRKEKKLPMLVKKPTSIYGREYGVFQRQQKTTQFKPIVLDEKKSDRIFYPSFNY